MDNAVSQDPSSTLAQFHTLTHLEAALYTRSGLYSSVGQKGLGQEHLGRGYVQVTVVCAVCVRD